jgi:hypothetical protein
MALETSMERKSVRKLRIPNPPHPACWRVGLRVIVEGVGLRDRVQDVGLRVSGVGLRIKGLGLRGFRVQG